MNRFMQVLVTICGAMGLAACVATTTPETDSHLGESLQLLRAQQTLNPDASSNTNPVLGLDGKAAKGAMDNYRDSFRAPPSESSSVLSIGVGSSSGH